MLRAEERAVSLEQELFTALRERVAVQAPRLQATAAILAELDVLATLGVLAVRRNYCRPEIVTEPMLDVRDGRHPVLDRLKPSGEFVPNDIRLGVGSSTRRTEWQLQTAACRSSPARIWREKARTSARPR